MKTLFLSHPIVAIGLALLVGGVVCNYVGARALLWFDRRRLKRLREQVDAAHKVAGSRRPHQRVMLKCNGAKAKENA
jgi:hypothetical protein